MPQPEKPKDPERLVYVLVFNPGTRNYEQTLAPWSQAVQMQSPGLVPPPGRNAL
jgi:hypothetical protein